MKIVIDVPDVLKNQINYDNYEDMIRWYSTTLYCAINDGIVLPKGHGDLKDADALAVQIAMIRDKYNCYGNEHEAACFWSFDRAVDEIVDAPTIIEADKGEGEQE